MLASGSNIMAIGALIKNDTGETINSIKMSFTAEFWRSSTSVQNVLTCAIGKVDGSTITTANFLTETSAIPLVRGNITGPLPVTTTNGALDGNAVANQAAFTGVVIPLQLAPGETGFIRWSDVNDAGNDAGLAIDNLKMTASLDLPAADGDGAVSLANSTPSSPYALSAIWPREGTGQAVAVTITPLLDSTTLTSVSVLVPTGFGTPALNNVTSSGGATGGVPAVTGQLVTLTGVSITKANPGVINIAGLSTPSTATIGSGDGIYPFTVSTAGDGGTLKAVFASPQANVLIPIANIRGVDANYSPINLNKTVAVEGVCTWGYTSNAFLQDSGAGVNTYSTTVLATPLTAGRTYAVVGKLTQYNGLTEITPTSAANVVNVGPGTLPQPITLTLPKTATEMETYEGMLVKLVNLSKSSSNTNSWAAAKTIAMQDSSANPIDVRIDAGSTATSEPAYPVTVTGVLGQYTSAVPRSAGYQLMPRTMDDLSFAPGLRLAWSVSPVVILENGAGFDTSITYLTLSRVGSSTGTAEVQLSISPAGQMLNGGQALPQTITFADGEASKVLALTPVDDSVYTGDRVVTIMATDKAGVLTVASATAQILEDDVLPAPTNLSYSPSTVTGTVNAAITAMNPTVTGTVSGYSVSPALPTGITINATNGVISGTPTVTKASTDYTVTATNASGSTTAVVTITVNPAGGTFDTNTWLAGQTLDSVTLGKLAIGGASSAIANDGRVPVASVAGGKLVLSAIVRTNGPGGLSVMGEAVNSLADYGTAGSITSVPGQRSSDQSNVPEGCERQEFKVDQGTDGRKFIRLKATLP
ncbi:MAG: hypothetical protein EBS90_09835 [Betaproteobacteria bacterium]|nr:hypothetical protein [Betaproteobacteria bacterium]